MKKLNYVVEYKHKVHGYTFIMGSDDYSKFMHTKNARGKYINSNDDYEVVRYIWKHEKKKEAITDLQFYVLCGVMCILFMCSLLLYIQWNY